jgi:small-conductance mechanosensitive channel
MAERIEKLILETEYRTTGVEGSAQQLAALEKATSSVVRAEMEKVSADKKVEQSGNALNQTIKTETKVQSDLTAALKQTGSAMSTLAQTNKLKDTFKVAGVKDLTAELQKFQAAASKATTIDELTKSMDEFVASLPEDLRGGVIEEMGKAAEKTDAALVRPVARLRELKRLINTETDPVLLKKYQIEAGKLQDKIGDTNDLVRALASDTFLSDTLVEGAQTAVSAFTAFQGVLALTTDDQEEYAKAAAKASGALAVLQGFQSVMNQL